jgi:hypothetical protein
MESMRGSLANERVADALEQYAREIEAAVATVAEADQQAAFHRDLLGQAIVNAAAAAGIIHDEAVVDGPTLLMLCEDLGQAAATPRGPRCGEERYELDAYIWRRESTQEWVLEISGTINDTNFTCRHPQPLSVPPEDVAGLPYTYGDQPRVTDEMVERAAYAMERAHCTYYDETQFEIWWNRDPLFVTRVGRWPDFEGTKKERVFWEARNALEGALLHHVPKMCGTCHELWGCNCPTVSP